MVASLKKIDGFVANPIDQPVFLCDTPGPTTCKHISERLRFAWALERIAHNCLNQIQYSDSCVPVGFDPMWQVLSELGMEDGDSFTFPLHRASLDAIQLQSRVSISLARRSAVSKRRAFRGDRSR